MSLLNRFIENTQNEKLFEKKDDLFIAVSGGIDSVALCELCYQAGFNFQIAHCNFQLRGEESERDEHFVTELGKKYNVPVQVKRFETEKCARKFGLGIQETARNLRYEWLGEMVVEKLLKAADQGYKFFVDQTKPKAFILTAHHANDSIETLLMNLFKGTGIAGLQGIPIRKELMVSTVRPLLFAKREEISNFVRENNLSFVEDSSNLSDKYTRNYIRNQLIPSIQNIFPQVEENLIHNLERFREINFLYQEAILFHKEKLFEPKGDEIHIPVLKLLKAKPLKTIVYEIIRGFGFTAHQTDDALHLLKSDSGKFISSATHKIIKNRKWLIIAPINNLIADHILINEDDAEIEFAQGKLMFKRILTPIVETDDFTASLDADTITFPLLLRQWKRGDYFYPLGMQKKKKLSKFFIDKKMSITEKEKVWVLESDKKIIWVIGKRIDDRYKVTDTTKKIIRMYFNEL